MTTGEGVAGTLGSRISHVVINVSDLARSVTFYEATTTLRRRATITAPPQSFGPFGIEKGEFDAVVMVDAAVDGGPDVHLVQWSSPPADLSTYGRFHALGLFRLCLQSAEVEKIYKDVVHTGASPFTAPLGPDGEHQQGRPVFSFPDPDGTVIEYVTRPGPTRLYHVNCNCSDLARSSAFYEQSLGFQLHAQLGTTVPTVNSFAAGGPPATFKASLLCDSPVLLADGRPRFILDLVEWTNPKPTGTPYLSQMSPGIVRLSIVPSDFGLAHDVLAVAGATPVATLDYGEVLGHRRYFTVRDPDGVVIEVLDAPIWPNP